MNQSKRVESEPELKPCPFCGSAVSMNGFPNGESDTDYVYEIQCDCDACSVHPSAWYNTEVEAARIWNTRAGSPQPTTAGGMDALSKDERYRSARAIKDFLFEQCKHNRGRAYDWCPECIINFMESHCELPVRDEQPTTEEVRAKAFSIAKVIASNKWLRNSMWSAEQDKAAESIQKRIVAAIDYYLEDKDYRETFAALKAAKDLNET